MSLRVVFLSVLLLCLLLTSYLSYLAYSFHGEILEKDFRAAVQVKLNALLKSYSEHQNPQKLIRMLKNDAIDDPLHNEYIMAVRFKESKQSYQKELFEYIDSAQKQVGSWRQFELPHYAIKGELATKSRRLGSEHYDIRGIYLTIEEELEIFVGRNVDDLEMVEFYLGSVGWICAFLVLLAGGASYRYSQRVLSEIENIGYRAKEVVTTGRLDLRIPSISKTKEMGEMVGVLNDMLEQIEFLFKGLQTLSSQVAHDLRSPLTRLRNKVDALEEGTVFSDESKQELLKEFDGIFMVFQTILRISRLERRVLDSKEHIAVSEIVEDVCDMYEPMLEENGIHLCMEVHAESIYAQKDIIFQVLANLFDNANKYCSTGDELEVRVDDLGKDIKFEFKDSGPGIEEAKKGKVFDLFFRSDSVASKEGFGLGLSFVKAAIESHRGEVGLSNCESGFCIWFTIPQAQSFIKKD